MLWDVEIDMRVPRCRDWHACPKMSRLTCVSRDVEIDMRVLRCRDWHACPEMSRSTCMSWDVEIDMHVLRYRDRHACPEMSRSTCVSRDVEIDMHVLRCRDRHACPEMSRSTCMSWDVEIDMHVLRCRDRHACPEMSINYKDNNTRTHSSHVQLTHVCPKLKLVAMFCDSRVLSKPDCSATCSRKSIPKSIRGEFLMDYYNCRLLHTVTWWRNLYIMIEK